MKTIGLKTNDLNYLFVLVNLIWIKERDELPSLENRKITSQAKNVRNKLNEKFFLFDPEAGSKQFIENIRCILRQDYKHRYFPRERTIEALSAYYLGEYPSLEDVQEWKDTGYSSMICWKKIKTILKAKELNINNDELLQSEKEKYNILFQTHEDLKQQFNNLSGKYISVKKDRDFNTEKRQELGPVGSMQYSELSLLGINLGCWKSITSLIIVSHLLIIAFCVFYSFYAFDLDALHLNANNVIGNPSDDEIIDKSSNDLIVYAAIFQIIFVACLLWFYFSNTEGYKYIISLKNGYLKSKMKQFNAAWIGLWISVGITHLYYAFVFWYQSKFHNTYLILELKEYDTFLLTLNDTINNFSTFIFLYLYYLLIENSLILKNDKKTVAKFKKAFLLICGISLLFLILSIIDRHEDLNGFDGVLTFIFLLIPIVGMSMLFGKLDSLFLTNEERRYIPILYFYAGVQAVHGTFMTNFDPKMGVLALVFISILAGKITFFLLINKLIVSGRLSEYFEKR